MLYSADTHTYFTPNTATTTDMGMEKVLEDKVVVEGVNVCKKHLKPKNNNGTGEIVEVERPIHKSNVMLVDPKTKKPTKVKIDFDKNGKKIRISKKSNEKID